MFGSETEYAFTALDANGKVLDRAEVLGNLLDLARARLEHALDIESRGIFLGNGSRFYIDCGCHPELSTPECTNPWDGARYLLAGDQILDHLARQLVTATPGIAEIVISRCNVDYSGAQTTWGCHESYLTRSSPRELAGQLLPHLVSRILFTGAGGFNNRSRGLAFTLSPRVPHLTNVMSSDSTQARGILHTKNEPLCDGYRRLHLICGESLCSQIAVWLKLGTTALVVAMAEAGLQPGSTVRLARPIHAMQTFASDPTCTATAATAGEGARLSALDIQRHYLQLAEAHADADFMPDWAGDVCQQWRAMLDRLEDAPVSVATTLDWALKLQLFQRHVERRGFDWATIGHWSSTVDRLHRAHGADDPEHAALSIERLLRTDAPQSSSVARLKALLHRQGLSWNSLEPFLDLTRELFEIDTRFTQLGPRGVFGILDRAGTLDHALFTSDDLTRATTEPPTTGRARWRGEAIRALASSATPARATWQAVWNDREARVLRLNDPFGDAPPWSPVPDHAYPDDMSVESRLQRMRRRMSRVLASDLDL